MQTIHVKVPRYIASYYAKKFGTPCRFDAHSVVCSYMRVFMQDIASAHGDDEWNGLLWLQGDTVEDGVNYSWMEIELPRMGKDMRQMAYIAPRGRRAVVRLLRDIIAKHVWCDLAAIITSNANVSDVVSGWCEVNGISENDENSIRQMYYRQRENLQRKGVHLTKSGKNRKKA